jgi:RNA polymerase sigma-70 factor, ECF subfamily
MMRLSVATPLDSFASEDSAELHPEALSIERLKLGNLEALGELYDRHHAAVRAFACRLVGDAASAEDLVHEVFLSIPNAIRNFKGDSSLRTFLIAIAVNMSRHHVRAATRRRGAIERMAREPVRTGSDPEGTAMREEAADALVRALDELSHDHRVAFVLCEVEERTSSEVAAIIGAPEGTVRTRLFHAKKKLRESLEAAGVR